MDRARLVALCDLYARGLADTVAFWERCGVDREQGGFFTCLDRRGDVYDTDKPVWFQGRATWLYATLYHRVEPRPGWLALARHGYDFLTRHCFDEQGKMYFLVDRAGQPLRLRRYVYSEVFATLACAALAEATGEPEFRTRAVEIFGLFVHHLRTPGLSVPKTNPSVRPAKGLAPLMCLVNLADTLLRIDPEGPYERLIDEAAEEILREFVRPELRAVLETVSPGGERIPGAEGRTMNPGHAIEAAWFLLEVARRRGDAALVERALPMIDYSLERGWDPDFGGLLYFVDVEGRPPTQLEHDLKLWWPHCEALYATLLAWHMTGVARFAEWFERLHAWTFAHFPDPEFGEWFGYLHRDGSVSTPLKGGIWKGPFHVPRAQLYCWKLLEERLG